MKITFVINSLERAGAERILSWLASCWAEAGHTVDIITFSSPDSKPSFPLASSVTVIPLGITTRSKGRIKKLFSVPSIIKKIRTTVLSRRPDIVVAFMDQANMLTLIALTGKKIPVIACERIHPRYSSLLMGRLSQHLWRPLNYIRNILYRKAKAVVVQTNRAASHFPSYLQSKIKVIPNPIPPPVDDLNAPLLTPSSIVGMGRLVEQKRFDLLITAFSKIAPIFESWSLIIFGDGPLRETLEAQIRALGLTERVRLAGATSAPHSVLKQAGIFVLCSDYEGFPGALAEAMALGATCIATDCPAGPSELIENNLSGVLIPPGNAEILAETLERLIRDLAFRRSLGEWARKQSTRFEEGTILPLWNTLLSECSSPPSNS